jgi:hypothetical protein
MSALIVLVLVVAAFVLAAVDLIQSNGRSLTAWAVLLLAVVLMVGRL